MKSYAIVFVAFAAACTGAEWDAFKVTYGAPGSGLGYYDMPWTVKEATAQGKWVEIEEDKRLNVNVYSQHEDPRVLLLFDKKENIAGIRLAFLKDDIKTKAEAEGHTFDFEYDNNHLYERGNYYGKDLWHTTILFASPSKLASGGRKPLNKDSDDVAEGLYFKAGGKWTELSKEECKPNNDFTEGSCFPGMGKHYFYKLSDQQEDCKHKQPFFSLYKEGKLIGVGLAGYGSFSKHPKTQSYYEEFPAAAVKSIMPNGPKCVEEYVRKYGITQMHIFLKKDASEITCPSTEWRSAHC